MWFVYSQNNSGGSFHYDETAGISHRVYIEADDAAHADYRAERIGIYFDGWQDCNCCGNRWYNTSDYDEVKADEVPEKDAPFIIDQAASFTDSKSIKGYEYFVHPLKGEFYGAGKDEKIINKHVYGKERCSITWLPHLSRR